MERHEVLALEARAWVDLTSAVGEVRPERREVEGVVPGWSTKDAVWHIAYWVECGANAVHLIHSGQPEPADEEATEAENAAITSIGRTKTWDEVMSSLAQHRISAREALGMFHGETPERAIEFFADYTIEHYREHEPQIRAFGGT